MSHPSSMFQPYDLTRKLGKEIIRWASNDCSYSWKYTFGSLENTRHSPSPISGIPDGIPARKKYQETNAMKFYECDEILRMHGASISSEDIDKKADRKVLKSVMIQFPSALSE